MSLLGGFPADAMYSHNLVVEKLMIQGDMYGDNTEPHAGQRASVWLLGVSTQLEDARGHGGIFIQTEKGDAVTGPGSPVTE